MPNLVFLLGNYQNADVVEKVVNYIIKSPYYEQGGYAGCFIDSTKSISEEISNSFNACKNVHFKNDGKQLQHIVIGFGDLDGISETDACTVANAAAMHFFQNGHQVFWGMHFSSDSQYRYRHIHMVVNTINMATGLRYSESHDNMLEMKNYMKRIFPSLEWRYESKDSCYIDWNNDVKISDNKDIL